MCDWENEPSVSAESAAKMLHLPYWIDKMPTPRVIKTHQMLGTLHPDLLNTCKVNSIYKKVKNNDFVVTITILQ